MIDLENVNSCLVCSSAESEVFETTSSMMHSEQENWSFRKCSNCEMVFLSPRLVQEKLGHFYTDSYLPYRGASAWGKYSNLVHGDQQTIDKARLKVVQKFISKDADTIMDIGCGQPSFLKLVQEKTGLRSVGIDFSDNGWNTQVDQFKKLELHVGSVETSSSIQADAITMWHYLEHDYDPQHTLQLLSQNQKAGTKLIIEVPNHDSDTRKKYGKFWSGYHTPRHTGLYTPKTIKRLLESSGWEVESQYTYGTLDPYTLDWMSRMEKVGVDWTKSMEPYFMNYVMGKLLRPKYYLHKYLSLGFMTVIARNKA